MSLFSYIYYRTYSLYSERWGENDPKLYAVALNSIIQLLNLISLFYAFSLILNLHIKLSKLYILISYSSLIIINWIWFSLCKNYQKLNKRWEHDTRFQRKRKGILSAIYIGFSIVFCYVVATYYGRVITV